MITGAKAMIECLKAEGVQTIFGYPGATIAPFYDELRESGISHILTRTEQGAGHAASGYARITGQPGVCVSTSGPGATNLLTAIATAYSDSIPLVAITGQVATTQLGRDVFQEVDTTGAAEPFTKHSYLVKTVQDIPRIFKEAFYIASTGRKGPVLIDIPVDVQTELLNFSYPETVHIRGYKPKTQGHPLQIRKVADAIAGAKRPLICAGGGVFLSGAQALVQEFCEKTQIPVVSTLMGIGLLPADHPLYFGMLGQSGTRSANMAVSKSDLLILIGARVGDRAITRPKNVEEHAAIVHIDIDSAEIGKNLGTTIPVVGDISNVLQRLLSLDIPTDCQEFWSYLHDIRSQELAALSQRPLPTIGVSPRLFLQTLCKKLPPESIYIADVGQNQIWSAKNFCAQRGRFLTTGGMGTMGYSVPAAIGAKLAAPHRTCVAVCGDGAFQMSLTEIATMCQHQIAPKIVVMRNGKLGMVKELQLRGYGNRESCVDLSGSPDFSKIAQAYGISYAIVNDMSDAESAMDAMLSHEGAFLLECTVSPEEVTF